MSHTICAGCSSGISQPLIYALVAVTSSTHWGWKLWSPLSWIDAASCHGLPWTGTPQIVGRWFDAQQHNVTATKTRHNRPKRYVQLKGELFVAYFKNFSYLCSRIYKNTENGNTMSKKLSFFREHSDFFRFRQVQTKKKQPVRGGYWKTLVRVLLKEKLHICGKKLAYVRFFCIFVVYTLS